MKKITVAVIDSGVDSKDVFFKDKTIIEYRLKDGEFVEDSMRCDNLHGTEVSKILLKEAPNVQIVSLQVLGGNNHGKLSSLVRAVELCEELRVDVINLSLGFLDNKKRAVDRINEVISSAVGSGITVFAADNNRLGVKSYPAHFEDVIGVSTLEGMRDYCVIDSRNKMISFSDSFVYVPGKEKYTIRRGNSYLCSLIAGCYCDLISSGDVGSQVITELMDRMSNKKKMSKIFYNQYDENERNILLNKKVLFFADNMNGKNKEIYSTCNDVCCINECYDIIYHRSFMEILPIIKEANVLFIGELSSKFINEEKDYLKRLLNDVSEYIDIIMVYPILNISERWNICVESKHYMKSIYK